MWKLIKILIPFFVGAGIGTVLMCILSVGKDADRMIEEMKKESEEQ